MSDPSDRGASWAAFQQEADTGGDRPQITFQVMDERLCAVIPVELLQSQRSTDQDRKTGEVKYAVPVRFRIQEDVQTMIDMVCLQNRNQFPTTSAFHRWATELGIRLYRSWVKLYGDDKSLFANWEFTEFLAKVEFDSKSASQIKEALKVVITTDNEHIQNTILADAESFATQCHSKQTSREIITAVNEARRILNERSRS